MDPLVATLFLVLIALLGARFSFSTERVPAGPRLLFRTGTHFLFVGFLLGPPVLELMSREAITQLFPLLGLGLGWVGMLFGLQLDRTTLDQFPRRFLVAAVFQAALAFLVVLGVGVLVAVVYGVATRSVLMVVAIAAAIASVSTPGAVAMVSSNFAARGEVRRLLFFIASIDGLVGVLALDLAYALFHDITRPTVDPALGWFWALSSVGLAVVCAVAFLWLGRLRPNREELVLYLLGVTALSAGAALQLQLSPLFVGIVIGAIVINVSPDGDRIFEAMRTWEKPIYVVMLLLAGALLRFPTWWILPIGVAYAGVRLAAKVVANAAVVGVLRLPTDTPRRLGLGLVSQGGISLAMVLSAVLTLESAGLELLGVSTVELLFAVVVIGVVLSELVGPFLVAGVLARACELRAPSGKAARHAPTGAPDR